MRRSILLLLFLMLLCCYNNNTFAQTTRNGKYAVVTFEVKRKNFNHPHEWFHWIVAIDSMKKKTFTLSPLFFNNFSTYELNKCIKGSRIDVFSGYDGPDFSVDKGYAKMVDSLFTMIDKNKIKVQTIKKSWGEGRKENITVYVTPVIGSFCNCLQDHIINGKIEDMKGLVFLPVSGISFDDKFWSSDDAHYVKFTDYSYIDFSSYSYHHRPIDAHSNFKNQ
jgi:hypothetical protein